MSTLFGSRRRAERRERDILAAAQLAASMRSNFDEALQEVLRADRSLTLRVDGQKLEGCNGSCTIGDDDDWHGADYFLHEVQSMQRRLGKRYKVVGRAWVSVTQMSAGLQMDLAMGYSNPRFHAMEHRTEMVEIRSAADLERNRRALYDVRNHWLSVSRRI